MSFVTSAGAEAKPPLARAIGAALPRGRNVTVAPGGALPARSIAYNTRMNRLFDKSIVLACCIAAALGLAVDARLVAAFCLGVIATSLAEVAQGERTRRTSEAASYVYIIAAVFVPPFVPFAPLAFYDIARRVHRERVWPALGVATIFAFVLAADFRAGMLPARTLLLTAILSVAAILLSLRTAQLEREQQRMRRIRDELQERALALEAHNRDLADRQDYEVELATLAERARIAREIHDNVGHQLTRASLQAEALRVVHADEPGVAADFADVKRTVDEALQLVRASVHALNDNAVDLSVQLERIVEGARSDGDRRLSLKFWPNMRPQTSPTALRRSCARRSPTPCATLAPRPSPYDAWSIRRFTSSSLPTMARAGSKKQPGRRGGHGARLHARAHRGAWRHLHRRPACQRRRLARVCHRSQTARR